MFNHMVEQRGKVLWQVTTSLDGFISGPGDDMDWMSGVFTGPNPMVEEFMANLGACVVGRRTWGVGTSEDGEALYGGAWNGPTYVVTHHVPQPGDAGYGDPVARYTDAPLTEVVATALEAADGKNVNLIGASVAAQCLAAGLVDEIYLHVAPVMLGAGTRLFEGARLRFDWTEAGLAGGVANLRLRPRAAA
jgi:dihydrofolate reductase